MAFLRISNISIKGVSACVPSNTEENLSYEFFAPGEAERVIASTGIRKRHISPIEVTSSDLCFRAAEELIEKIGWQKSDIECLVYVSQTPDYILPPTSCVLQKRLGLSERCFTIDSSAGCPGWINGLALISSVISSGGIKRGLLLVGETPSKYKSRKDKTSWPLFGDAGTATAIEFDSYAKDTLFYLGTEGQSFESIIIPEGGFRHPFNVDSLVEVKDIDGIFRNRIQSRMDGMSVFSFGLKRGTESIRELVDNFKIDISMIDYFFMHQANRYMNEKIRKKLSIPEEKMPYSLEEFGNTSCATIPLTMVVGEKYKDMSKCQTRIICCAFGVGLSWGSVYLHTNGIEILPLIYLD